MSGTLYVVATPIGNLEDITFRAVRILGEVDRIACEDTRQTRKLLDRYSIATPLVSYHEHNEQSRSDELLRDLLAGKSIALVSDAGTPLIADPGYRLVRKARQQGVRVTPVPGPSALLVALSASGLATDAFLFGGFVPPKKSQRRKLLEELKTSQATLVFYEAPHRILETLDDVAEVLGDRPIVLARELTKIHEEFLEGAALDSDQERDGYFFDCSIRLLFRLIFDGHLPDAQGALGTNSIRDDFRIAPLKSHLFDPDKRAYYALEDLWADAPHLDWERG